MDLKTFKDELFKKAIENGFSECELYYSSKKELSLEVLKGEISKFQNATTGGLSFRGLIDGKMAYSYSEKIDESVMDTLIQYAKENAKILEPDEENILFEGSENYQPVDIFFDDLEDVEVDTISEKLLQIEKNMLEYDEKISPCYGCRAIKTLSKREIYNTKGLSLEEKSNRVYMIPNCLAKDGDNMKVEYIIESFSDINDIAVDKIAEDIAIKSLEGLGAKSLTTGEYKIVFSNECFSDLLSCFVGNFYAENIHLGLSLLKGKLNEQIASDKITLVDAPLMAKGFSTYSFDSEGVACFDKTLVENGTLKTYLYNLKYAKKDGVQSTGNGFKLGFKDRVATSHTNFYIKNGNKSLEELFGLANEGIYITSLSGLHSGVNNISGDFSLIASGFKIEDGVKSSPVDQITVAGNFYSLLKEINEIGNDLKFETNAVGSPSVFAGKLSVAGEN